MVFIGTPLLVTLLTMIDMLCDGGFLVFSEGWDAAVLQRVRGHFYNLHKKIKKELYNSFGFLFYIVIQLMSAIFLASSAERLAKIAFDRRDKKSIFYLNALGFMLESVPQLVLQVYFMKIEGANIFVIISCTITCYRCLSSFGFKFFQCCFRAETRRTADSESVDHREHTGDFVMPTRV
jgi:hypothetical protein